MRLSTRTQYGLRMLCQLASEYQNGPMQMNEIGQREGISEKYLGQIMLILRSSGLVQSVRGAQGGYYLARAPHTISVKEIFEIVEGEVLGIDDEEDETGVTGSKNQRAAANEVWKSLREAMGKVLASFTLADLLNIQLSRQGFGVYDI
jgi:Rrf2 family protein